MPINRHEIVDALPPVLEPNTLYFVNIVGSHRVATTDENGDIISYLDVNTTPVGHYAQLTVNGQFAITDAAVATKLTDVNYYELAYAATGAFTNPAINRITCGFDGVVQIDIDATWHGGDGAATNHHLYVAKNGGIGWGGPSITANSIALSGSNRAQHTYRNGLIVDVVNGDYFELYYTCPTGTQLVAPLLAIKRLS